MKQRAQPLSTIDEVRFSSADFLARVDRSAGGQQCWPWTGARNWKGYGKAYIGGRWRQAHRVAYVLHHGTIDPALHVDHTCRNRACCNPDHLEAVTNIVNIRRGQRLCRCGEIRPVGSGKCWRCGIAAALAQYAKEMNSRAARKPRDRLPDVCRHGHHGPWRIAITKQGYRQVSCRQCARLYDRVRDQLPHRRMRHIRRAEAP